MKMELEEISAFGDHVEAVIGLAEVIFGELEEEKMGFGSGDLEVQETEEKRLSFERKLSERVGMMESWWDQLMTAVEIKEVD